MTSAPLQAEAGGRRLRRKLLVASTLIAFGAAAFLLGQAAAHKRDPDRAGTPDNPLVLLLAPTHAAPAEALSHMAEFLTREVGLTVSVQVAPSEEAAIAAAANRSADAWLMPLFAYLYCQEEYGVEAALQVLRGAGERTYRGVIVTRADGPGDLAALTGRRIAYVDPHSTSGFIYPAALLADAGATPVAEFAGTHAAVLEALRAGRVEAAATHEHAVEGAPDLRVLATTPEIPNEPVFVRRDLAADTRERLQRALLAYAATDEGKRTLAETGDLTGLAEHTDAAWWKVKETVRAADRLPQDLVAGGWWLHHNDKAPAPTP
jgi:phosphonate transport system substrate-binding protein